MREVREEEGGLLSIYNYVREVSRLILVLSCQKCDLFYISTTLVLPDTHTSTRDQQNENYLICFLYGNMYIKNKRYESRN